MTEAQLKRAAEIAWKIKNIEGILSGLSVTSPIGMTASLFSFWKHSYFHLPPSVQNDVVSQVHPVIASIVYSELARLKKEAEEL